MNMSAPSARYRLYTFARSYLSLITDLVTRRFTKGDEVERLEREIARRFGVAYAAAMPMARVGIHLALKALIKPGQEVIMSPYTIADVVNMVISAGGRPVFADIDRHTTNILPSEVEKLIGPQTGAVLITHLHGIAAPAFEIRRICERHGVPMLEDAAQAFGGILDGKRLGTIGEAGIYSLGMYKNINAWYGGMIVSNNKDLIDSARREINRHGYQSSAFIFKRALKGLLTDVLTHPLLFRLITFWIFRYGYLNDVEWINKRVRTELDTRRHDTLPPHYLARLTPFQARLALSQLDRIDAANRERTARGALYRQTLAEIDGLIIPREAQGDSLDIYLYYPVQHEKRQQLIRWLMSNNRDVAAQHLKNCADLEDFSEFYRDCPNARATAAQVILLPTYPRYSRSEVEKTARAVRSFFNPESDDSR